MKQRTARPQPPMEQPELSRVAITRRELVLIGMVLVCGMLLRLVALSRSAVEHFDEGVYASNLYFGPPDYAYPMQRFYAPPLLPALIEAELIAGLPPNLAALLPSFLAGCGTIAALWWFGRSWFGPPVGLCAATLCAFSDFHILYSATALTDVLLGLLLILAVDAIGRSLLNADYRWAIGAGIYTGLAWWTKYNGWLPLAIEGAALPVLWLLLRPPRKELFNWLVCFAITVAVAAAIWTPYYFSLRDAGGYGPIAANHAKYVVGLMGWFDSATRQICSQLMMESLLGSLCLMLALALPWFLPRRETLDVVTYLIRHLGVRLFVAALLGLVFTSFVVAGVCAVVALWREVMGFIFRGDPAKPADAQRAVGLALLCAWFAGLAFATPCYTAYPRLVLPWLLVAWLGGGLMVGEVLREDPARIPVADWPKSKLWLAIAKWIALLCLFEWTCKPHEGLMTWSSENWALLSRNRRGIEEVAKLVRENAGDQQPRVIYVAGEPALHFQLRAAGEEIVVPVQEAPTTAAQIDGQPVPTFLIAGPHANADPHFRDSLAEAKARWKLMQTIPYEPSAVVWLDLHDPRKQNSPAPAAEHAFLLYEFQP